MGIFIPQPPKADGQILFGADLNDLNNRLASFLGANETLGNVNVSSDPLERIKASKILFDSASHGSTHEPSGVDEINDIDIGNTGTLLTAHASRHADGGSDPIPAAGIVGSMIAPSTFTESNLAHRKPNETVIARMLGLPYSSLTGKEFNLSVTTAQPGGRGVVRNGLVYFSVPGAAPDAVVEWNPATDAETFISLVASDNPGDLLLIGTDIYVICRDDITIKKIDITNAVTTVIDLNSAVSPTNLDATTHMTTNADGTVLYIVGKIVGQPSEHVIVRVSLSGPTITHKVDVGAGANLGYPWFVRVGSTDYIVAIDGRATAVISTIYRRDEADLAAVDTFALPVADSFEDNAVYDGQYLVCINDQANEVVIYNPAAPTMFEVARFAIPTAASTSRGPGAGAFFDGKASYLSAGLASSLAMMARIPSSNYQGGTAIKAADIGAAYSINGFASDGTNLYCACSVAATSNARLVKLLL